MDLRRTATLLLLPLLAGCGGEDDAPIHLGVAVPLDLSYGQAVREAVELAVDEVNRDGGIDGRSLALVVRDDEGDPSRAIEVARELRDDPRVVAIVGHVTSAATLAAAEVYNRAGADGGGVLAVSPTASSPHLSDAGDWTFRVCPTDLQYGPRLAQWTYEELGRRRAAVIYANDVYGRGVRQSFTEAFERAGGTVISRDPYLSELMDSPTALDPYIERALRDPLDALIVVGYADEARSIVRAARRLGYTGPILGGDGLIGIEVMGAEGEGVFVTTPFLSDRPTPRAQAFVRAYTERYGRAPDGDAALGYDAVQLIIDALRDVLPEYERDAEPTLGGVSPLRRALRDRIARVGRGSPAFEGVTGRIAFDENGDVNDKEIVIGTVRDGQLVTPGS